MELRHLKYFVAVAECLNFTEAARQLHVAQPSISQQIADLEKELGTVLMVRNNRTVRLTAAGEVFLKEAREVLGQAERAAEKARRASRGEVGELRIGFLVSAVSYFLPGVIRSFRRRYPWVTLSMGHMNPTEQLTALAAGRLEVALTRPFDVGQYPGLTYEVVYRDRLVGVVPAGHRLAEEGEVSVGELAGEEMVLFSRGEAPGLYDGVIGMCQGVGWTPEIVSEPTMMETVLLLVEAGMGVSIVPGCVGHLRHSGIRFVGLAEGAPGIELVVAWRKEPESPVVRAFLEELRPQYAQIQAQSTPPL